MSEENNNVSNQPEFEEVVQEVVHETVKHNRRSFIDRMISVAFKMCVLIAVVLSATAIFNEMGQKPWNPNEVINEPVRKDWVSQQVQKVRGYNVQIVNTGFTTWAMHKTLFTHKVDRVYFMIPFVGWIRTDIDEKALIKG